MRIGIDGIPLTGAKTGVGHYTLELARGLAQIADTDSFEFVTPARILSGDSKRDEWPANLSVTYREPNSLRKHWWTIGLPLYIRQSSLDLFIRHAKVPRMISTGGYHLKGSATTSAL